MTPRLQNKINSLLSGWYTEQFNSSIVWHGDNLVIKDLSIAGEIVYNLTQELGLAIIEYTPTDPKFHDWNSELEIAYGD